MLPWLPMQNLLPKSVPWSAGRQVRPAGVPPDQSSAKSVGYRRDPNKIDRDEEDISPVPGCFEFRQRSNSFEKQQFEKQRKAKLLDKRFRTSSDTSVDSTTSSLTDSPQGQTRRQFKRVIRDPLLENTIDGRYVVLKPPNPIRTCSVDSGINWGGEEEVSGSIKHKRHITKLGASDDGEGSGSVMAVEGKRTTFQEEVVVIEFDKKGKIQPTRRCSTHVVPLHGLLDVDDTTEECAVEEKENTELKEDTPESSDDVSIAQSVASLVVSPCDEESKSSVTEDSSCIKDVVAAGIGVSSDVTDTLCSIKL